MFDFLGNSAFHLAGERKVVLEGKDKRYRSVTLRASHTPSQMRQLAKRLQKKKKLESVTLGCEPGMKEADYRVLSQALRAALPETSKAFQVIWQEAPPLPAEEKTAWAEWATRQRAYQTLLQQISQSRDATFDLSLRKDYSLDAIKQIAKSLRNNKSIQSVVLKQAGEEAIGSAHPLYSVFKAGLEEKESFLKRLWRWVRRLPMRAIQLQVVKVPMDEVPASEVSVGGQEGIQLSTEARTIVAQMQDRIQCYEEGLYHKVLGVPSRGATEEEIKVAGRKACLKFHPDKVLSHPELSGLDLPADLINAHFNALYRSTEILLGKAPSDHPMVEMQGMSEGAIFETLDRLEQSLNKLKETLAEQAEKDQELNRAKEAKLAAFRAKNEADLKEVSERSARQAQDLKEIRAQAEILRADWRRSTLCEMQGRIEQFEAGNHQAVLKVSTEATEAEIKAAGRKGWIPFHPDKVTDDRYGLFHLNLPTELIHTHFIAVHRSLEILLRTKALVDPVSEARGMADEAGFEALFSLTACEVPEKVETSIDRDSASHVSTVSSITSSDSASHTPVYNRQRSQSLDKALSEVTSEVGEQRRASFTFSP